MAAQHTNRDNNNNSDVPSRTADENGDGLSDILPHAHVPKGPEIQTDPFSISPTSPSTGHIPGELEESYLSAHTLMTSLPAATTEGDGGVLVSETPEPTQRIVTNNNECQHNGDGGVLIAETPEHLLTPVDPYEEEQDRREQRRRADPYNRSNSSFRRLPTPPFTDLHAELLATRAEARIKIENAIRDGEEDSKYYLPPGHYRHELTRQQRNYRDYITNRLVGLFVESPVKHPAGADFEIEDDFDPLEGVIFDSSINEIPGNKTG